MSQQTQQPPGTATAIDGRQYPTRDYQPQEVRVETIRQLDQLLADTMDLASQVRFAHWNVRGMQFFQLHELFEELYDRLAVHADEIAERTTSLGGQATGTVRSAAANSRISPFQPTAVTGPECLEQLAERLATHDANLYEAIEAASARGDLDTADLLNEVSREVGKYRWFVEAHLETQPVDGLAGQPARPHGQQAPRSGPVSPPQRSASTGQPSAGSIPQTEQMQATPGHQAETDSGATGQRATTPSRASATQSSQAGTPPRQ